MCICYDTRVKKTEKLEYIVGIDEVGRGPLAGPLYMCATMMKVPDYKKQKWQIRKIPLNDSKLMTKVGKEMWFQKAQEMKKDGILNFVIAQKSAAFIDRYGMSKAIKVCITEMLEKLVHDPKNTRIELDGSLRAPDIYQQQETIIKGDKKRKIISLASVIAKVSRDTYMEKMHKKFPLYNWEQTKGYGTKAHREAIQKYGTTKLQRNSFLKRILDK